MSQQEQSQKNFKQTLLKNEISQNQVNQNYIKQFQFIQKRYEQNFDSMKYQTQNLLDSLNQKEIQNKCEILPLIQQNQRRLNEIEQKHKNNIQSHNLQAKQKHINLKNHLNKLNKRMESNQKLVQNRIQTFKSTTFKTIQIEKSRRYAFENQVIQKIALIIDRINAKQKKQDNNE